MLTAKLVVNHVEMQLNNEMLANMLDYCLDEDCMGLKEIAEELVKHPISARLKAVIAKREDLSVNAILKLSDDKNHAVLSALIENETACQNIPSDRIYEIFLSGDAELTLSIFNNIERISGISYEQAISYLIKQDDPDLRLAVACDPTTKSEYLMELTNDVDYAVRTAALHSRKELSLMIKDMDELE